MSRISPQPRSLAPEGADDAITFVSAEAAAFALLRLQQRIRELERENALLRRHIPPATAAPRQALTAV